MSTTDKYGGGGVVSEVERRRFVEAVLAEKLVPDFIQAAYHFAGWLDSGARESIAHEGRGTGGGIIAAIVLIRRMT